MNDDTTPYNYYTRAAVYRASPRLPWHGGAVLRLLTPRRAKGLVTVGASLAPPLQVVAELMVAFIYGSLAGTMSTVSQQTMSW